MLGRFVLTLVLVPVLVFGPSSARAQGSSCQWSGPLPPSSDLDGLVHAMVVHDDGSGPALFVGGTFTTAGSLTVNRVAKWNGSSWSALGTVNPGITSGASVFSMVVYDDGSGPALYVGGNFSQVGGWTTAYNIAKWKNGIWSKVGDGLRGSGAVSAYAMAVWDDPNDPNDPNLPTGPALYVGGSFTIAGSVFNANRIAKWNGVNWSAVGTGMDDFVNALVAFDDDGDAGPNPPALYAGGGFLYAGLRSDRMAKWDGYDWSPLKSSPTQYGVNSTVHELGVYDDDGAGPHPPGLFVGGQFTMAAGVPASRIAKWGRDSVASDPYWSTLGDGTDLPVYSLIAFDNGSSSDLYAGGVFAEAGGIAASRMAKWDGSAWSALGDGVLDEVRAMAVYDDDGAGGDPDALFVGGDIMQAGGASVTGIAKWSCSDAFVYGDITGDCVVNLLDLAELLGHYGVTSGAAYEDGDLQPVPDGDGDVDLFDLAELLGHWGETCP